MRGQVFRPTDLERMRKTITQAVWSQDRGFVPLCQRGTGPVSFLRLLASAAIAS